MTVDVVIVGGGPAGAVTAWQLANRGLEVCLVEQSNMPRHKPCGGGITLKTVLSLPFDASPVFEKEAIGGIVSYAGRQLLKVDVRRPFAWLTTRSNFDAYLVAKAVAAGARLLEGIAVTGLSVLDDFVRVQTSSGSLQTRFLVGADGIRSVVARLCGLLTKRQLGTALEAEVVVPGASLATQGNYATFDFGALPNGYGWIFPKNDHLSVGVYHARPGKAPSLKPALQRFLASHPVLGQHRVLASHGHQIPLGGSLETLHSGRVLLTGDAANLADPWLGEGICYAVRSALMAAEAIEVEFDNSTPDLSMYTNRVQLEIVKQLRYARHFAGLVYRLPRLGSLLISQSSKMQEMVFDVIRGDLSFQMLYSNILKKLPKIFWQAFGEGMRISVKSHSEFGVWRTHGEKNALVN